MFEVEKIEANSEYESFTKDIIEKHREEISSLLDDAGKKLGEGRTANVCFLESNNKVCIKIYKRPEMIIGADFYLPAHKERQFLEGLKGLNAEVRVPKVYASFKDNDGSSPDFLMMENLPAVSVDDVLEGRAELPADFNLGAFRDELADFVEKMHSLGIYHRDLHEGNIMIDKENAKPYVIDFGAASEFLGEPEPGERGPYSIRKDGRDITLTSDESMIRAIIKKISGHLTKAN